jgi:hypothetical protein
MVKKPSGTSSKTKRAESFLLEAFGWTILVDDVVVVVREGDT